MASGVTAEVCLQGNSAKGNQFASSSATCLPRFVDQVLNLASNPWSVRTWPGASWIKIGGDLMFLQTALGQPFIPRRLIGDRPVKYLLFQLRVGLPAPR